MERIFLGWQQSLGESAAQWLWQRRELLTEACIVVPTAQAGRRLRERLTRLADNEQSAILGLQVVTPAAFYEKTATSALSDFSVDSPIATSECELLAWMQVLETIADWTPYRALFPLDPGANESPGWSYGLAKSLDDLQRELQEGSMDGTRAAELLREHPTAEIWQALQQLRFQQEQQLQRWQRCSRYRAMLEQPSRLIALRRQLIVIGVTDASPWLIQCWEFIQSLVGGSCQLLIAAPPELETAFDMAGRPTAWWTQQELPLPGSRSFRSSEANPQDIDGSVTLCLNSADQANAAVRCAATAATPSDQIALITLDSSLSSTLANTFTRAGWITHDPQQPWLAIAHPQWLQLWRRWLQHPSLTLLCEMLPLTHSQALCADAHRYAIAKTLSQLRQEHLYDDLTDFEHFAEQHRTGSIRARHLNEVELERTLAFLRHCHSLRQRWLSGADLVSLLTPFISIWQDQGLLQQDHCETSLALAQQLDELRQLQQLGGIDFWLKFFIDRLPQTHRDLTLDAVLDVQGWIELSFDSAQHVILCGANETLLPARNKPHPWLGDNTREQLGLTTDALRHARDAYLFRSLCESRRHSGRIDLLFAKHDTSGTALLPSRLLLQCSKTDLPRRVEQLFCDSNAPSLDLAWHADWQWKPRAAAPPLNLSITSLKTYLTCPMEFYLKHCLHMNRSDNQRRELDAASFGTTLHSVLEQWATDDEARHLTKTEPLQQWLRETLHRTFALLHGTNLSIALRLQLRSMEQRLHHFAIKQVQERLNGWQVIDCEKKISIALDFAEMSLKGKIDRIDQNTHTGAIRLWDYKTSHRADKSVEPSHLRGFKVDSPRPAHLCDPRAEFTNEKNITKLWHNLQLPLYAYWQAQENPQAHIEVGYISLGSKVDEIQLTTWKNFTAAHSDSAFQCAQMIAARVHAGDFAPADRSIRYAPAAHLAAGASLREMIVLPPF